MCVADELMELVTQLTSTQVSAEVFEQAIGAFLVERKIEPVAGGVEH
jgi:hypothetical protein